MGPRAPGRKAEVEVPGARRAGGGGLRWPFRGHSCGSHATRGGGRRRLGGGESQRRASRRSGRRASWLAPWPGEKRREVVRGAGRELVRPRLGGAFGPGARSGPVGSHRWFLPKVFRRLCQKSASAFWKAMVFSTRWHPPETSLYLISKLGREEWLSLGRNPFCRDATPKAWWLLLAGRSAPVAVKFAS